MDYVKHILTPHSTYTQGSPLVTTVHLTRGTLVGGWLYFPPGPASLLHLVVLRGLHQILPSNQGADYALDDAVVKLYLGIKLDTHPLTLTIHTWNDSTQYDHTCDVCFFLKPLSNDNPGRRLISRLIHRKAQGET